MQVRLAPLTLLAGIAAAVGTVAVYQSWWGLALGAVTSLLLLGAAPRGWGTRMPYGVGYALVVGLLSVTRGEGDYLVLADVSGYVVLGLGVVVLVVAVSTALGSGHRRESPDRP